MNFPDVVILAGGRGTRLQDTVPDLPKPMAPVAGKPFLEYLFNFLKTQGASRVIISVGYMSDKIISHFGFEYQGTEIVYASEESPLGTGGGIKLALGFCHTEHVLIYNGDSFFTAPPINLFAFHQQRNSEISLYLKPMKNPHRYGTVALEDDRIIDFKEKNTFLDFGLINAGVYCVRKNILDDYKSNWMFSFEKEILEATARQGGIYGLISDAYFIDIGIPEDYRKANETFGKLEY